MMCQFQCALEELMGAHWMDGGEPHRLGDINIDGAGDNHIHIKRETLSY